MVGVVEKQRADGTWLVMQDNKHDALNQRSPAPESGMFGVPGVGHSKPALLSPGRWCFEGGG